jgi:hypothetical protein
MVTLPLVHQERHPISPLPHSWRDKVLRGKKVTGDA